jgi:hypothetical protein
MSLQYLKEAVANGDTESLIRYVRLHFGDGTEAAGAREIDKAWIEPMCREPSSLRRHLTNHCRKRKFWQSPECLLESK